MPDIDSAITLRPVSLPDDEEFLFELYCSTRDDLAMVPLGEQQKRGILRMQYDAQKIGYAAEYPDLVHYIVLYRSTPAGRLIVERRPSEILGVDLALLSEFRNLGIGTAVLMSLFDKAAETGSAFVFHVLKTNPAIRLYKRLGCTIEGESATHYKMRWDGHNLEKTDGNVDLGQI